MKILLVGDQHGDQSYIKTVFNTAVFMNVDRIFQLGDYGFGWKVDQFDPEGYAECVYAHLTSQLVQATGIPFYWLDGNHENFNWLEAYMEDFPDRQKDDGTWEVAKNVFYVPRGTLLNWDNVRFLVCGGGTSINKKRCIVNVSWFYQEEIKDLDVDTCAKAGEADILLTHDFPWEVNVVDRHLDSYWGEWAINAVTKSRKQISKILYNCKAKYVFHGHLHLAYTEQIEVNGQDVQVYGLDCNGNPIGQVCYLLDTADYKE